MFNYNIFCTPFSKIIFITKWNCISFNPENFSILSFLLFISLIIIARSGTAIATELANMRINKEIQLLESQGINYYYFLIFPRIIGMVVSMLCLTVYFHFFTLATEFAMIKLLNVGISADDTLRALTLPNFVQALLKMFFIGLSVSVISCYFGLSAKKSYTEVPQVTTKGVVNSIIVAFILSVIFTALFAALFGLSFTEQRLPGLSY